MMDQGIDRNMFVDARLLSCRTCDSLRPELQEIAEAKGHSDCATHFEIKVFQGSG